MAEVGNEVDLAFRRQLIIDREKPLRSPVDVRESAFAIVRKIEDLEQALARPGLSEDQKREASNTLNQLTGARKFAEYVTGGSTNVFDKMMDSADQKIENKGE